MGKENKSWLRPLAILATMGVQMAITTFVGLWIGLFLDGKFHSEPWLMIVFTILGAVAGFVNFYRAIKKYGV